jgi:hypothetical protein
MARRRRGRGAPCTPASALRRRAREEADVALVVAGIRAQAEEPFLKIAIGAELGCRQLVRDPAVHHHADAVGDVDRDAEVLLDQQDRDLALRRQAAQRLDDLLDDHRREALGRLVHHQQLRLEQERAADGEHLRLAARELRAAVALALGQAREHRVDPLDVAAVRRDQAQGLVDAERRPDAPSLRHVGDAAPGDAVRRHAADLFAEQPDAAAAGTSPVIALHSVVLPMPLRPTIASTPRSSAKLTPCSTWARP